MAGIRPVFEKGPLTFKATTVANGGNIAAGTFVMPDTANAGYVTVATAAGAATCLGLAIGDAAASDYSNAPTNDDWGNPVVNAHTPPNEVAVAYQGVWLVEVTADVAFGALVTVGAGGLATPFDAAAGDSDTVVGRCVSEGGITAGNKGRILLGGVGA